MSRDRGGGYGEAAARALPHAIQVADRWHLMENTSTAFLDAVRLSMRAVRGMLGATIIKPALLTAAERLQHEGFLSLQAYLPALLAEWEAGCHNGAELWRRLRNQGFKGCSRVVGEWTARRRRAELMQAQGLRKVPAPWPD